MRKPLDRYDSPRWMIDALLSVFPLQGRALEPCVGSGHWIAHTVLEWVTNDIDPTVEADYHLDATLFSSWERFDVGAVITNPPFSLADQILANALRRSYFAAFLLRANWEEPTKSRYELLRDYPYNCKIVLPRYCFTKSTKTGKWQTDSCTCHWYIWCSQPPTNLVVYSPDDINTFSKFTRNPDEELAAWR